MKMSITNTLLASKLLLCVSPLPVSTRISYLPLVFYITCIKRLSMQLNRYLLWLTTQVAMRVESALTAQGFAL